MAFSRRKLLIPIVTVLAVFSFGASVATAQTGLEGSPENNSPTPAASAEDGGRVSAEDLGFDAVSGFVYDGLTAIGALIAALGGKLLDVSLSWFVWSMADTTVHFGLDTVIDEIWSLIRDLFNLLFIFGLVFIGFKIILEIDEAGAKKTLGTLIVAALLINFSLYITQVVVDFGNIMAAEIHGQFEFEQKSSVMGLEVSNISSEFIRATSLNSLSSTTLQKASELGTNEIALPKQGLGIGHALALGLTVTLMLTVIGFVFAAGALIMFTRFMYLIFLMIFSPIMFLGFVLPAFKQRSKDWWHALINQTFIGPAYLFMLFIALKALEGLKTGTIANDISITAFIMSCLIVSAFAWAALMVARKMGAYGASMSMSMGESMGKAVRGSVKNATVGAAGRYAIGRPGVAVDKWLAARGWSDKSTLRGITSTLAGTKYGGKYSEKERRESAEKARKAGVAGADTRSRRQHLSDPVTHAAAIRNSVRSLSNEELADEDNLDRFLNHHVAIHLTDAQIEEARKSGNFSAAQIQGIKDARRDGFREVASGQTVGSITQSTLFNRSSQQIGQLPVDVFTNRNMATQLTASAVESRLREGVTDEEAQGIATNIQDNILNDPNTTTQQAQRWQEWVRRSNFAARLNLNFNQAQGNQQAGQQPDQQPPGNQPGGPQANQPQNPQPNNWTNQGPPGIGGRNRNT